MEIYYLSKDILGTLALPKPHSGHRCDYMEKAGHSWELQENGEEHPPSGNDILVCPDCVSPMLDQMWSFMFPDFSMTGQ